ncbi:hypothetical protein [Allorhizobium taibaishanense]|uniref:Uncharacterized protein n=1 Tax=Allorhizobium taibaishanense TaxID=887144 RepID=A0A7W6MUH1_9HYPH|nr:hypothetical protein [Allorhizobium taibaishanense]MBB4008119.1 hypothetical protein [Allorhizobium taibaishanense]
MQICQHDCDDTSDHCGEGMVRQVVHVGVSSHHGRKPVVEHWK